MTPHPLRKIDNGSKIERADTIVAVKVYLNNLEKQFSNKVAANEEAHRCPLSPPVPFSETRRSSGILVARRRLQLARLLVASAFACYSNSSLV